MRIIWTIIGGIAGFMVADAAFAILAYLAMGAPSAPEGKPASADILAFGPLVGLLGLGLGIWLALRLARRAR